MKCELCGREIADKTAACPVCTSAKIRGKIENVLRDSIRFFSKNPVAPQEDREICFQVGNFHRLGGMYDEAVVWYERALSGTTAKPEYLRSLASALAAKGDYKSAVEAFQKAAALAPQYADYHNDLGAAYFKNGKHDEAIASLQEAIRLNPRYANAHNNLAFAYRKKGMFQEAEKEIKIAIELEPQHAVASYALGLSYFSGGMFSQLRDPLKLDAKTLADIYLLRGMYPEAVKYYQRAVEIHPKYADYHYCLAMAYAGLGDKEKARTQLEAALKLNPHYAKAKTELENLNP